MVPVLFIVMLGVVSYQKASDTIIEKYKESSISAIAAESLYLKLLCETVSSKALEVITDADTKSYYEKYYDNKEHKSIEIFENVSQNMVQMASSISFFNSYHIIAQKGTQISSESLNIPADAYTSLLESEEGAYMSEAKAGWLGEHKYLDEALGMDREKYSLSYFQKFLRADAIVIMDIRMNTIFEALQNMDFGENSYKGVVTRAEELYIRIVLMNREKGCCGR